MLEASDSDSFSFGNGTTDSAFSISAWIRPSHLLTSQFIISKYHTTDKEWVFYIHSGRLYLIIYDQSAAANQICYQSTATMEAGNWYHVVGTYDGTGGASAASGMKLYIDGAAASISTSGGAGYVAMENGATKPAIANQEAESVAYDFNGNIAEVAVWAEELTATEVATLYRARLGINEAQPDQWYPVSPNQMNLENSVISPFDDDTIQEEVSEPLLANNGYHDALYKQTLSFSFIDDGHMSPNEKDTACGFTYGGKSRINSLVYGGEL
jgi:hypothetical protein